MKEKQYKLINGNMLEELDKLEDNSIDRIVTPKGGTVLDPFIGSGSTGKALIYENKERNANYKFIGIELENEYFKIAETRINYASGVIIIKEINKDTQKLETKKITIRKQKRLF